MESSELMTCDMICVARNRTVLSLAERRGKSCEKIWVMRRLVGVAGREALIVLSSESLARMIALSGFSELAYTLGLREQRI